MQNLPIDQWASGLGRLKSERLAVPPETMEDQSGASTMASEKWQKLALILGLEWQGTGPCLAIFLVAATPAKDRLIGV